MATNQSTGATEATNNAEAATTDTTQTGETGASTPPEGKADIAEAVAGEEGAQQTDSESASEETQTEDTSRGAPEQYKLGRPESLGEDYELDGEVLSTFEEVARELDLTNDAAQGVVDKVLPKMVERALAQHQATVDNWIEQVQSDPEFGGQQLESNLKIANAAVTKLGDQSLRDLLTGPTGIGNHPAMVRFMFKVGKLFSEDRTGQDGPNVAREVTTQGDPTDPANMAARMYPNTPKPR